MTPNQFNSRKAAHTYLIDRGYALPYRTFCDAVKRGDCRVENNGKTILLASLQDYIDRHLGGKPSDDTLLAKRKLETELEINLEKLKKLQLDNRKEDDRWLDKERAYAEMAAIFGLLRDTLRHHFHLGQSRLVLQAGGDQSRGAELYDEVETILSTAFNEVASLNRVHVVFEGVDE